MGAFGRLAALYDIHGNAPALEAVLAEVRAAGNELIVVGGDVVPGPMPTESYPQAAEFASGNVLAPPSEATMLAACERIAIMSPAIS